MTKTIEGEIKYTIEIKENEVNIKYNTSVENDLAMLVGSQYITEMFCVGLMQQKKEVTGKEKQIISASLEKSRRGRDALNLIISNFVSLYEEFKKNEEANSNTGE